MTKEDKELLFKDLCARLPYNVKVSIPELQQDQIFTLIGITQSYIIVEKDNDARFNVPLNIDFIPYLRPMSSMTNEEEREYNGTLPLLSDFMFEQEELFRPIQLYKNIPFELYEFFNSNYFDYRGLIPKGLAIEVTKENNPYK